MLYNWHTGKRIPDGKTRTNWGKNEAKSVEQWIYVFELASKMFVDNTRKTKSERLLEVIEQGLIYTPGRKFWQSVKTRLGWGKLEDGKTRQRALYESEHEVICPELRRQQLKRCGWNILEIKISVIWHLLYVSLQWVTSFYNHQWPNCVY